MVKPMMLAFLNGGYVEFPKLKRYVTKNSNNCTSMECYFEKLHTCPDDLRQRDPLKNVMDLHPSALSNYIPANERNKIHFRAVRDVGIFAYVNCSNTQCFVKMV